MVCIHIISLNVGRNFLRSCDISCQHHRRRYCGDLPQLWLLAVSVCFYNDDVSGVWTDFSSDEEEGGDSSGFIIDDEMGELVLSSILSH